MNADVGSMLSAENIDEVQLLFATLLTSECSHAKCLIKIMTVRQLAMLSNSTVGAPNFKLVNLVLVQVTTC